MISGLVEQLADFAALFSSELDGHRHSISKDAGACIGRSEIANLTVSRVTRDTCRTRVSGHSAVVPRVPRSREIRVAIDVIAHVAIGRGIIHPSVTRAPGI